MAYVLLCRDKTGALQTRLDNRPVHLDFLKGSGKVIFAGPFIEDEKPVGSMVVLDVATRAEAEAFAAADPYAVAGLFDEVVIREWRKVIG